MGFTPLVLQNQTGENIPSTSLWLVPRTKALYFTLKSPTSLLIGFSYTCTIHEKQYLLNVFKPLQRGIVACMTAQNMKVVKACHGLLEKLLPIFPVEVAGVKTEELDTLYSSISSTIYDGLVNYETNPVTTVLYGPVMLLKGERIT